MNYHTFLYHYRRARFYECSLLVSIRYALRITRNTLPPPKPWQVIHKGVFVYGLNKLLQERTTSPASLQQVDKMVAQLLEGEWTK